MNIEPTAATLDEVAAASPVPGDGVRESGSPPGTSELLRKLTVVPSEPVFLGIVIIAVLACGLMAWRYFRDRSPGYALDQAQAALVEHNGTKLAYYADPSQITAALVDQSLDWLVRNRGVTRTAAIKLGLEESADRSMSLTLAGNTTSSAQLLATLGKTPPFNSVIAGDHLTVTNVGAPHGTKRSETVPVTIHDEDVHTDVTLSLVMTRAPGRWRITGVKGVGSALSGVDNAQLERVTVTNRPVEERLASAVTIGAPVVQHVTLKRHGPVLEQLQLALTNNSTQLIGNLVIALSTRASDDDHASPIDAPAIIPPGATATETWQFDETAASSTRIAAMLAHPEKLTVHVRQMVVDSANGADTLRIARHYSDLPGHHVVPL